MPHQLGPMTVLDRRGPGCEEGSELPDESVRRSPRPAGPLPPWDENLPRSMGDPVRNSVRSADLEPSAMWRSSRSTESLRVLRPCWSLCSALPRAVSQRRVLSKGDDCRLVSYRTQYTEQECRSADEFIRTVARPTNDDKR